MEELIRISTLNDFLLCPVSIYHHNLMDRLDRVEYQSEFQLNGAAAHRCIDSGSYTTSKDVLLGTEVCSVEFGLIGKFQESDSLLIMKLSQYCEVIRMGYAIHEEDCIIL